ncbi:galactose metabolism-related protein [Elasticomyces elasticus]|nr:galactose metabolism-related protein [Elasticomyces elasticus]
MHVDTLPFSPRCLEYSDFVLFAALLRVRAMGNSQSQQSQTPPSPHHTNHLHEAGAAAREIPTRRASRRKQSLPTVSNAKSAAPPSATLDQAQGHYTSTSTSTSSTSQTRNVSASSRRRDRSAAVATPKLIPQDSTVLNNSMGAETSKPESHVRHPRRQRLETPPPPQATPSSSTAPVNVPAAAVSTQTFQPSPIDPTAPSNEAYNLPPSNFSRPPRLPLPIGEEIHAPGSPVISSADVVSPIDQSDLEGVIPRRSSVLSSTTVDDDDLGDDNFQPYNGDTFGTVRGVKVPTVIEWKGQADKVYVTGTFVNWERKFKLQKHGPSSDPNVLSATLQLPPGTHHLKFIVDNEMTISTDLPQTVDFTNILVNYIEVAPPFEDQPGSNATTPIPTPDPSQPVNIPLRQGGQPPDVQTNPLPTPESKLREPSPSLGPTPQPNRVPRPTPAPQKPKEPPKQYTPHIPQFLLDLDIYPAPPSPSSHHQISESPNTPASRYYRASKVISAQPPPPTLPSFLSKSILNSSTPMKDDSSVLVMPNHTMLNHLATSSIRQYVLATSSTTRYKRKTDIRYRAMNTVYLTTKFPTLRAIECV